MARLDTCESLFPSSRQLILANPSWGDEVFKTRYRTLYLPGTACSFYNTYSTYAFQI